MGDNHAHHYTTLLLAVVVRNVHYILVHMSPLSPCPHACRLSLHVPLSMSLCMSPLSPYPRVNSSPYMHELLVRISLAFFYTLFG